MSNPMEQTSMQYAVTLEEIEQKVELYECYQRLKSNPDFKKLFEEFYLRDEVLRLNSLLAHPEQSMVESREHIMDEMRGISSLTNALILIDRIGASAKDTLEQYRAQELAELAAEDQGLEA